MRTLFFGLTVSALLAGLVSAADAPGIQTDVLAKSTTSWDGSPLPDYPTGTPEVTVLRLTIPPGGKLPLHEHPVINAAVLLRGDLTVVTAANKTLHVTAGEGFVEVVNQWHSGTNTGDTPAELVVFYAGVEDTPITVKKSGHR